MWLAKTGQTEVDLLYYRDHAWPDALTFLEQLSPLCYKVGVYGQTLDEIMKFQSLCAVDTTATISSPPNNTEPPYKAFADLFVRPEYIELCINALRQYRPEKPVLGEGNTWTGSRKDRGLIVGWIERMETMRNRKIYKLRDRKMLVKLLNEHFEGLDMGKDASVFASIVRSDVKESFVALIPE